MAATREAASETSGERSPKRRVSSGTSPRAASSAASPERVRSATAR